MVKTVNLPKPAPDLLLLHIELKWITPPVIWRRFVVPENITLGKLHRVILVVAGWTDSHLYELEIAGEKCGMPDPEGWGPPVNPEARKTLVKALLGKKSFDYLYDFGDGWDHRIKVEKLYPRSPPPQLPYCIDGASACPPEDMGGVPGYEDFLEAMADPKHPEQDDMVGGYGETFEPTAFDCEQVNQWFKRIKV